MYDLDTDPKEMLKIFGCSGSTALFEPMMRDIMPVSMSFPIFSNLDYSKMIRSK
jgi:hypothetical protein